MTATTVTVKGFTRLRFFAILFAISIVVAVFLWLTVHRNQGIAAAATLPLASAALARWGGPHRLAREVTVTPEAIEVSRFTTVKTSVPRAELASAQVIRGEQNSLELVPHDPQTFFIAHPELADSRVRATVRIPIGKDAGSADALEAALA